MSKLLRLAALIVVVLTVVATPITYALGWYELTVLLLAIPGAVASAVALDVHRRVSRDGQRSRRWQKEMDRQVAVLQRPPARADALTHEDLLGAIRLIQDQHEGRLERAQSSLDEAVRTLRAHLPAREGSGTSNDSLDVKQSE